MDFAQYSIALIFAYAFTRYVTENTKIHVKFKGLWLHHWILSAVVMVILFYFEIDMPIIWGALTGIALEGLPRKNWSIRNKR